MNFSCPRCEQAAEVNLPREATDPFTCPNCQARLAVPEGAWQEGRLTRCLVCPSTDLFVRKDFPQGLGVAIVVLGFAVSCVTWYLYMVTATFAVLFATALADLALYLIVGDSLVCYRCGARYRDVDDIKRHEHFDLETHERYRQHAARLAQAERVKEER